MRVERSEGGVQHAAPHLSVAVVKSVGDEEEEERGDLRFVQVLGQLVQRQSNATPDKEVRKGSVQRNMSYLMVCLKITQRKVGKHLPVFFCRFSSRHYGG